MDSSSYRKLVTARELRSFQVQVKQTDLHVSCAENLYAETLRLIRRYRRDIEEYVREHSEFLRSLTPLPSNPQAPEIVRAMLEAAAIAGVGPMATVAGAVAQFVGNDLRRKSPEVIVENGGDIFLCSRQRRECLILAEKADVQALKIVLDSGGEPMGVCTSSGTLGHSLSFGRADAVTAVADSAVLADAAATAIGNRVRTERDIEAGLAAGREMGLKGLVILVKDAIGAWGSIELKA